MIRTIAHLSVVVLAAATAFFVNVEIPRPRARVSASGLLTADEVSFVTASSPAGAALEQALLSAPRSGFRPSDAGVVSRLPVPHTIFPQRPRARVITYVVQRGDTVFDVAARFGLLPTTVVWSNREVFRDAPWLVRAGTELFILPVDGVYHTARSGETVASIAAGYGVDPADLYNEWNDLRRGRQPRVGQLLVVPGGEGGELAWQPPLHYPAPGSDGHSDGICGDAAVAGPGGHGWFTYPTGGSQISGWYFHDPRRPMHIGIDYRCGRGDPIYATDNGVVILAGRNGPYGIMVEIHHGSDMITRYAHLDSVNVECGSPVYQGDLIGHCGNTGWSSGAHLHFEIRHRDVPRDPQTYLPPFGPD